MTPPAINRVKLIIVNLCKIHRCCQSFIPHIKLSDALWKQCLYLLITTVKRNASKMHGTYLIVSLFVVFLPFIEFCAGNMPQSPFPSCNQPFHETVQVNRGLNATWRLRLFIRNYNFHWRATFTWVNDKGDELCSLSRGESCYGIDSKFYMAVSGDRTQSSIWLGYVNYIDLELAILKSGYSDEGIFTLHSSANNPCTLLRVTIDVLDAIPLCTTSLMDEINW